MLLIHVGHFRLYCDPQNKSVILRRHKKTICLTNGDVFCAVGSVFEQYLTKFEECIFS